MQFLLFVLALHFAPAQKIPTWHETESQRVSRYASIASDIHATVDKIGPLPGLDARQSAVLLLAVAVGESGLAPDADLGPCYREGGYKDKLAGMSDDQALSELAAHGKLIKRPLLLGSDVGLVGFREAEWKSTLA